LIDEPIQPSRYSMIVEWEPVGAVYVVTVPELPGCQTHGRTDEEAIRRGQEVVAGWVETARLDGQPVPPPRFFDLGDDVAGDATARGAETVGAAVGRKSGGA